MSKTSKYGFVLAQTTGFTPNYGFVKGSFDDADTLQFQHNLRQGEVIWYVDAEAFTYKQAEELARQKAQELYGNEPVWMDSVLDQMLDKLNVNHAPQGEDTPNDK